MVFKLFNRKVKEPKPETKVLPILKPLYKKYSELDFHKSEGLYGIDELVRFCDFIENDGQFKALAFLSKRNRISSGLDPLLGLGACQWNISVDKNGKLYLGTNVVSDYVDMMDRQDHNDIKQTIKKYYPRYINTQRLKEDVLQFIIEASYLP
jgi:hypothetical protein